METQPLKITQLTFMLQVGQLKLRDKISHVLFILYDPDLSVMPTYNTANDQQTNQHYNKETAGHYRYDDHQGNRRGLVGHIAQWGGQLYTEILSNVDLFEKVYE